ncbi:MAG: ferrochelatase [Chloroflexota bacterium]|nr:MAG: ferrochelatase [Chloroflexota bacterium]
MNDGPIGVLLLAYGSPQSPDDIETYYTDIRRGRPPTPEQVAELRDRYRRIGGVSPLSRITADQATALRDKLGPGFRVYVGMKHWNPRIPDTVARMADDGIRRAVCLALAPHYSRLSIGDYHARVRDAAARLDVPIELHEVESWHLSPLFIEAVVRRVDDALARFPTGARDTVSVLFTAHSLPSRIVDEGDPYPAQLTATGATVAARLGLGTWSIAWQSAGRTPEPWLGPDVKAAMADQAARGARAFLVCPIGFVTDHLEVLYDLDIECRAHARALGVLFERTASPNADADFIAALAEVVRARLASAVTRT